jgi:hypothetical protein
VSVYVNGEADVRAAVEAFKAGMLPLANGATVPAHAGMGMGQSQSLTQPKRPTTARDEEIARLKSTAAEMRQQLAEVIDRIEELEKEI